MTLLGPPPFGVSFGGPTISSYFGFSVDGLGDLNGDGLPEVGFGASWGLGSAAQRVQIYSFGGFRRYGGLSIRSQFFALAPDLGSSNGLEFFLLD